MRKWALLALVIGIAYWYGPFGYNLLKPNLIQKGVIAAPKEIVQVQQEPSAPVVIPEQGTFAYPNLGITAPLFRRAETDPMVTKDWAILRQDLQQGVTLTHTEKDFLAARNLYVVGHSSDYYRHAYAYIFAGLGEAEQGDSAVITLGEQVYTYTVIDKKVLNPTDSAGFQQLQSTNPTIQRVLIVTCWPVFTTKERLVVIAERTL